MGLDDSDHNWLEELIAAESAVRDFQTQIAEKVTLLLDDASTGRFTSLKTKMEFANRIQRLLNLSERRIACPKCGMPATLTATELRGMKQGGFQFIHVKPKRTTHGGVSQLPSGLFLTPKLERKRY